MELRHLRYFIAVAGEQNVTRAAMRLRIAQPSLSRQIRDLECELGFSLFEHGPRFVRLTEAGRKFLEEARAILRRLDEAVEESRATSKGLRGEFHVGYAPSLAVKIMPRALQRFEAGSSGVRVHLHDLSTMEMTRGLREGKLHVALIIRPSSKDMHGLVYQELIQLSVCVAVAQNHRLARAKSVSLKQVAQERLVAFSEVEYPEHHEWIGRLFAPLGLVPRIGEEHDSANSLMMAVEAGRGVALVQECLGTFAGKRLRVRPISPAPQPLSVGVVYREGENSAMALNFVRTVAEVNGDGKDGVV